MRYFGSKTTVLPVLLSQLQNVAAEGTVCDPFGGIGTVGAFFKSKGYRVITGDTLRFAYYFQQARVQLARAPHFRHLGPDLAESGSADIVKHLNSLPGTIGWVTRHYAQERRFFTIANARRIDSVRLAIRRWNEGGLLDASEHALLVASLIDSLDRVANTAGTYYAFLKTWTRKALTPFRFKLLTTTAGPPCRAINADAISTVRNSRYDVLYLDPPYNERRYDTYYHLPESIALNYRGPVSGLSGQPPHRYAASGFNSTATASASLEALLAAAKCRTIILHYSDDGLIAPPRLRRLLSDLGTVSEMTASAKGYSTTGPVKTEHRIYKVACSA